jgi:predicted nucleic acid-binding protein
MASEKINALFEMNVREKVKAFLDTNIILRYLQGQPELQPLFSPEVLRLASFAVSPVVIQELLLAGSSEDNLEALTRSLEIIGPEISAAADISSRIRSLRNRAVHANDLLILESARRCDVLLTYDGGLLELGDDAGVPAITPETFLARLRNRS